MVGIISHVTELQAQLPYQLQVVTKGERSTFAVCDDNLVRFEEKRCNIVHI